MLDDGTLANALLEDLCRDLALAEARDLHLRADVLIGVVKRGLDLLLAERDREFHGDVVDLLEGAGHCFSWRWVLEACSRA